MGSRGVEQRQLVGLITRRSGVRIPSPQPKRRNDGTSDPLVRGFFVPESFPAEGTNGKHDGAQTPRRKHDPRSKQIGLAGPQPHADEI